MRRKPGRGRPAPGYSSRPESPRGKTRESPGQSTHKHPSPIRGEQLEPASAILQPDLGAHEFSDLVTGTPHAAAGPHAADLRLAREAQLGSSSARRRFAEEMGCVPRYLSVINARMGRPFSDDELEDLVQEVLMEIWRRLDSYAGLAALKTWAYRFCQQVLSSRLRALRRRPLALALDEIDGRDTGRAEKLDFDHVYAALDKVDEPGARIVRHKHFDQWTFAEIAQHLSIPESSAKAHYQRALSRLREILEPLRKEAGL